MLFVGEFIIYRKKSRLQYNFYNNINGLSCFNKKLKQYTENIKGVRIVKIVKFNIGGV